MTDCDAACQDDVILRELFIDDTYDAKRTFDPADRWLDVGSHLGWFSRLAMLHGADVVGAVDGDPEMVAAYAANIPGVPAMCMMVDSIDVLVKAYEGCSIAPNAIKMDIQGAELTMMNAGRLEKHLAAYDKVLIEVHNDDPATFVFYMSFEHRIDWMRSTTDSLTHQPTYTMLLRKR